jgi:hypothetical protein
MNGGTYRGAKMPSRVKRTSGGATLGPPVGAEPNKTSVSPDKTFFTRALPVGGRVIVEAAAAEEAMV